MSIPYMIGKPLERYKKMVAYFLRKKMTKPPNLKTSEQSGYWAQCSAAEAKYWQEEQWKL